MRTARLRALDGPRGVAATSVAVSVAISAALVVVVAALAMTGPESGDRMSRPAASTTPGARPFRIVLAGDSVAHTLAGAEVYEFPDFQEWQPGDSPFDPDRVTLSSTTLPSCSFLAGAAVYATDAGTSDVSFSDFCGDWRRDVGEAIADVGPQFVVVLLSNDATDRRLYGELFVVGSDGWQSLLDDALDEFRRPTEDIGSVLVLLTPPPRAGRGAASDDAGAWREVRFADGIRSYASRRPGVVVLDLAEVICPAGDCARPSEGFDASWRYDGWHFGGGGPAWVAQWLTAQLEPMRRNG